MVAPTTGGSGDRRSLSNDSDNLRSKIVEILAGTANGCLTELGYFPGMPQKLQELEQKNAQWQAENVKLFEDNRKLAHALRTHNDQSRSAIHALENQVKGLTNEKTRLVQQNEALLAEQPTDAPYQQLLSDYQRLHAFYASALGEIKRLYGHINLITGGHNTQQAHSLYVSQPIQSSSVSPDIQNFRPAQGSQPQTSEANHNNQISCPPSSRHLATSVIVPSQQLANQSAFKVQIHPVHDQTLNAPAWKRNHVKHFNRPTSSRSSLTTSKHPLLSNQAPNTFHRPPLSVDTASYPPVANANQPSYMAPVDAINLPRPLSQAPPSFHQPHDGRRLDPPMGLLHNSNLTLQQQYIKEQISTVDPANSPNFRKVIPDFPEQRTPPADSHKPAVPQELPGATTTVAKPTTPVPPPALKCESLKRMSACLSNENEGQGHKKQRLEDHDLGNGDIPVLEMPLDHDIANTDRNKAESRGTLRDPSPTLQSYDATQPESKINSRYPSLQAEASSRKSTSPLEPIEAITPIDLLSEPISSISVVPSPTPERESHILNKDVDPQLKEVQAKYHGPGGGDIARQDVVTTNKSEEEGSDDDDDDAIEVGPDGLRLVEDCITALIDDDENGELQTCKLCIARYNMGYTPDQPKPFRQATIEELVLHCSSEHRDAWEALRHVA